MTFLGHPRGLATLFLTEYWERFSYYGMRALLILFMTAPAANGGLGFDVPTAAAIYGIYTASVYLAALARRDLTAQEKRQLGAIAVFFVFSSICWSALEQAGSTLNLFAERHTDLSVFGFAMPASWLQSVTPILIISLSPVFAWVWIAMAQRRAEPSSLGKFVAGLWSIGLGFGVMVLAAARAADGRLVSPWWLVAAYLLQALGEVSFSPVGYSLVTKLSPASMVSQLLGVWLTSIALGNLIASRVAGQVGLLPLPHLFGFVAVATIGAGILLLGLSGPVRRLAGAIR